MTWETACEVTLIMILNPPRLDFVGRFDQVSYRGDGAQLGKTVGVGAGVITGNHHQIDSGGQLHRRHLPPTDVVADGINDPQLGVLGEDGADQLPREFGKVGRYLGRLS